MYFLALDKVCEALDCQSGGLIYQGDREGSEGNVTGKQH